MIAKCQTKEIQETVAEYINNAEWSIRLHETDGFWLGRLVQIYDMIWTLFAIDAISQKTFQVLTEPIQDFEFNNDFRLVCRYNVPMRG